LIAKKNKRKYKLKIVYIFFNIKGLRGIKIKEHKRFIIYVLLLERGVWCDYIAAAIASISSLLMVQPKVETKVRTRKTQKKGITFSQFFGQSSLYGDPYNAIELLFFHPGIEKRAKITVTMRKNIDILPHVASVIQRKWKLRIIVFITIVFLLLINS